MKALVFALPLFFVLGSFAQAADAPSCDWAAESFKSKVGDDCIKSLEGKITDEQDKIYARRIIKDWVPLKGYEISTDVGFFQAFNDTTGDFLQAQWLSFSPATLFVNGVVVVDDSKDPSMYRQIEKLFDKAAAAKTTASLSPFMKFLAPNEAFAAVTNAQVQVKGSFFLYTIDERGPIKAIDALKSDEKTGDSDWFDSNLKKAGILPNFKHIGGGMGGYQTFKCDASKSRLESMPTQHIDGHDVKIQPNAKSRTQFIVSGYPTADTTLLVDLKPASAPALPKDLLYRVKDKHNYPVYKRDGRPAYAYAVPCSGKHSESLDAACKGAWADLASQHDDSGKEKFPEVKAFLDKLPKDKDHSYGKDVKCELVFPKDAKKTKECRAFFFAHFKDGRNRFEKSQSDISVCEGMDCRKTKRMPAKEVAVGPEAPTMSEMDKVDGEIEARRAYQAALKADKGLPQGYDALKACPFMPGDGGGMIGMTMSRFQKCEKPSYDKPSEAVKKAYAAVLAGPEANNKKAKGDDFQAKLNNRLIGVMMMGECCGNATCAANLETYQNIQLNGAAKANQ